MDIGLAGLVPRQFFARGTGGGGGGGRGTPSQQNVKSGPGDWSGRKHLAAKLGGARTHRETPLAIPLMIFMTPHKPSNRRSKLDVSRIFGQHFPKLGPDLTDGTPYTTNLHVFLSPGWSLYMNIKNPWANESH